MVNAKVYWKDIESKTFIFCVVLIGAHHPSHMAYTFLSIDFALFEENQNAITDVGCSTTMFDYLGLLKKET